MEQIDTTSVDNFIKDGSAKFPLNLEGINEIETIQKDLKDRVFWDVIKSELEEMRKDNQVASWLFAAAQQDDRRAFWILGCMCKGSIKTDDPKFYLQLFRKSADMGDYCAQLAVGDLPDLNY
eukprot:TRINITY_DN9109_c0_g1_i2.p1 TRINITY_DN9109_c0_g1~~TRINITY_DN9109_c0_g1_i2.p1  ORF type:complete len:143 (+),score=20.54 TRINITY_DN9109_c0_g1_i2:65-430(+)